MATVATRIREATENTGRVAHEQHLLPRDADSALGTWGLHGRSMRDRDPTAGEHVRLLPREHVGVHVGPGREHSCLAERVERALHLGVREWRGCTSGQAIRSGWASSHIRPASSVRWRNSEVRTWSGFVKIFSGGPSSMI